MTSAARRDSDPLSILDDYDFELPESSIAQAPSAERDSARLMVLDRETGKVLESDPDHRVRDLTRWLHEGDGEDAGRWEASRHEEVLVDPLGG